MSINKRVAADTNALIRYLSYDMSSGVAIPSVNASKIFESVFEGNAVLFVSAISLIEIWSNIASTNEAILKFQTTTRLLKSHDNIRVVDMDFDIIKRYANLQHLIGIKEHDRIVVATAIEFECDTLITSDSIIHGFASSLNGIALVHS